MDSKSGLGLGDPYSDLRGGKPGVSGPLKTLEPNCERVSLLPAAINGQLAPSNCAFYIQPSKN